MAAKIIYRPVFPNHLHALIPHISIEQITSPLSYPYYPDIYYYNQGGRDHCTTKLLVGTQSFTNTLSSYSLFQKSLGTFITFLLVVSKKSSNSVQTFHPIILFISWVCIQIYLSLSYSFRSLINGYFNWRKHSW